jgi:tetraacyldisaccharide 4'-kinase
MGPASLAYRGATAVVLRWRLKRRSRPPGSGIIVSVGNLEVGGSGKTPLAAHLIGGLARRGHRPAYVSRGYRSAAERLAAVTVLSPPGVEPTGWGASSGIRLLRGVGDDLARIVGDEGALVAERCPDAPLAFSRDRGRAVEVVSGLFRPTHVVLDDSFQTWAVERDLDIVLLDAKRPLGNGRLLPAGSLREGATALRRAHVIGFNAIDGEEALGERARWVRETVGRDVPVFGVRRRLTFHTAAADAGVASGNCPRGRVACFSSVGRPLRFEESVAGHGVEIALSLRFPDHHAYGREDLRRIERLVSSRRIDAIVTTEKDWVKLRAMGAPIGALWVARLDPEVLGDDPVHICEKPQALPAALA